MGPISEECGPQSNASGICRGAHIVNDSLNQRRELDRTYVEAEFAGHDARDVEQFIDESTLSPSVAGDGFDRANSLLFIEVAVGEQM